MKKKKELTPEEQEEIRIKDYFDMIIPSTIKFFPDYYICGNTYRSVWALKEYAIETEQQALLSRIADKHNVTIKIYVRRVDSTEQAKVIENATRRSSAGQQANKMKDKVEAINDYQNIIDLISKMQKEREPLLSCAVYIELKADSLDNLRAYQRDITLELMQVKINIDKLSLRQREGFLCVLPTGINIFGSQFERALPASSVANLYPFCYSGKTDQHGFFIGRDKYGTNVIVDLDHRSSDKTNASVLVVGNSGQGKSYLVKTLAANVRESGKSVIILDPEEEYKDLTDGLGGCYLDFVTGKYMINPLEPKIWSMGLDDDDDPNIPTTFKQTTRLSQHIAYLKDFFVTYQEFNNKQINTLEIMLTKLYEKFGFNDDTDFNLIRSEQYPIAEDLYSLIEEEYKNYSSLKEPIYSKDILQDLLLGLNSMCRGSDASYFNGHTNIVDDKFLCFGIKGLLDTNKRLKNAVLFNLLSYMNSQLLIHGNTVGIIDELYLFFEFQIAVEYIRNGVKRVRKKDSSYILATQNIEDAMIEGIKEYTKPLFAIPAHQFIFNGGSVKPIDYMSMLQLEESEFDLIRYPERGTCLYKCGNERYLLQVLTPEFKTKFFGSAGGN